MQRWLASLVVLFILVLFAAMLNAADYTLVRDVQVMPGGGTGTNVVAKWFPPGNNSAEAIEVQAYGGRTADTATFYRVSSCGCVTNTLAAIVTPGPTTATVTNFNSLCSQGGSDYLRVVLTGTNTPRAAAVWRVHTPGR